MSAYATNARLTLAQLSVPDKTNEITAIPDLLDHLAGTGQLKGALVTKVKAGSAAAHKLRVGDVITDVGDTTVTSAREARDELKKADLAKGVRLTVTGVDGSRFVFLKSK